MDRKKCYLASFDNHLKKFILYF